MLYRAPRVIDDQEIEIKEDAPLHLLGDEELVARAQVGDQLAADELAGRYQQRAYAIAYHMCSGDRQEAEDLAQEAFFRAFRGIGKFRGDSSFYTWFYRIVVNTCLDGRRRRRRWERVFSFWRATQKEEEPSKRAPDAQAARPEGSNPMTALSRKELSQEIQKAMKSLSERQRVAFQLKVVHEMSIREIAQVMGAAEGTVKSHLFRAVRFMREELKEWA